MRRTRSVAALLLASLALSACFTGQRPSFGPQSDPAIAAVLSKLGIDVEGPLTATYSLLTRFGNTTTAATVALLSPTEKAITIGSVRYIFSETGPQTCNLTTGVCSSNTDDAAVSNLSLTHDFYGASPAARIRQDSNTMVGPAISSISQIAALTATCAQISFTGGSKKYCTLDNGLLAYQDSPDLTINLISVVATADPLLFTTSTVAPG